MKNTMQFKAAINRLAAVNHVPAQAVLQTFMLERLLERISISKYKNILVIKGGMLIASIVGISSRTTMDMDATVVGFSLTENTIRAAFAEICSISLDDSVSLILDHIEPIRDDDEYGGFRLAILAVYESIRTPLKVDITTGDRITPEAVCYSYPSCFEDKVIDIWSYNIETILAEKVETILRRGILNTRMRDFYDVYILKITQSQRINSLIFINALIATCQKRVSLEVIQDRDRIIQSILADKIIYERWERYRKEYYYARSIPFSDVMAALSTLLLLDGI